LENVAEMNLTRITPGEFWFTVRLVLSVLGRVRLLLPFLIYGALQLITVGVLCGFHSSSLSGVMEPVVRLVGGEGATHYPQLYIALPSLVEKSFVAIHVVLGSLLVGAATLLFWRRFERRSGSLLDGFDTAGRRYARLLGIALVVDLVAVTLSTLVYRLATGGSGGIFAGPFVARGISLLLALLVQTVAAYAVPAVMISNLDLLGALRRSVQIVSRNFAVTFLVVLVAFLPHVPLRYLASKSLFIVEKLRPELVAWLTGLDVVLGVVTTFLVVGAITQLYLFAAGEE
jgi:hypothetical protein